MWIVFGLIVGAIVHAMFPRDVRGGFWSSAILGILGALVGGVLSTLLFGVGYYGFSWVGFITAIVGGVILALLSRLLFRRTEHVKTHTTRMR